jgi:hypothetical protein
VSIRRLSHKHKKIACSVSRPLFFVLQPTALSRDPWEWILLQNVYPLA